MPLLYFFFFFNDTATTEIYTLSLHDALPISMSRRWCGNGSANSTPASSTTSTPVSPTSWPVANAKCPACWKRSEEHTSELQSQSNLVCRLLLEKKKKTNIVIVASNDSARHTL